MKRGFTTVELVVSSALVIVIVIFLFQIVQTVNKVFIENDSKTLFINDISLITYEINDTLKEQMIKQIDSCGNLCYEITYNNNHSDILKIENNDITFGDYTKTISNAKILDLKINRITAPTTVDIAEYYDSILLIEIPILYNDETNQIKVAYQYSSDLENIIYN